MFEADGFDEFAQECLDMADDMRDIKDEIPEVLDNATEAATEDLEGEMKAELHNLGAVNSGTLLESIEVEKEQSAESGARAKWAVGPTVDYAPYVEFGTDPHTITPKDTTEAEVREIREEVKENGGLTERAKNAPALQFNAGGTQVTVDMVQHPGSKAKPFFRNSFNRVAREKRLTRELDRRTGMLFKAHQQ